MAKMPPIPNCIQFTLFYNDQGNANVRNILYFKYTGTLGATDLTTLCNLMMTQWATHFGTHTNPGCSLIGVVGDDLTSDLAAKSASNGPAQPGTSSGTPITNGAALIIQNEISRKYRGGHSRNYLPGMERNSLTDGNTWSSTAATTLVTAWKAFLDGFVQATLPIAITALQHVVAHRFGKLTAAPSLASGIVSPTTINPAPFMDNVTALVLNPQVGSQRRRNQQSG